MDINPLVPKDRNIINSYGPEGFKINETFYKNSLIITPNQIIEIKLDSLEEFFDYDFKKILELEPEIFLIGTGENHKIVSPLLKNKIKNIYPLTAIDEMNTASVCRTYNILMMEDRHVAALLMFN